MRAYWALGSPCAPTHQAAPSVEKLPRAALHFFSAHPRVMESEELHLTPRSRHSFCFCTHTCTWIRRGTCTLAHRRICTLDTQDCPPQDFPPVANPEVGYPDIHRYAGRRCCTIAPDWLTHEYLGGTFSPANIPAPPTLPGFGDRDHPSPSVSKKSLLHLLQLPIVQDI